MEGSLIRIVDPYPTPHGYYDPESSDQDQGLSGKIQFSQPKAAEATATNTRLRPAASSPFCHEQPRTGLVQTRRISCWFGLRNLVSACSLRI